MKRRGSNLQIVTPQQNTGEEVASVESELPEHGNVGASVAGAATDDNDSPGDALPRRDLAVEAPPLPARFQDREQIEIERTGSIVTAGTNQNSSYTDTELPKSVSAAHSKRSIVPA